MSDMDPRDEERVRHGLLPIFVREARKLTDEEIATAWGSEPPIEMQKYEPWVKEGFVFWRPKGQ